MSTENTAQDPMEFMRNMWSKMGFSLPGMVTPTLDVDELDKRIADMKAVENWLKMNLNTLQMATQGLEMQRATIAAMQAMSKVAAESGISVDHQTQHPTLLVCTRHAARLSRFEELSSVEYQKRNFVWSW